MAEHADFVHLHTHTQYSLLDGMCKIEELIELAHRFKMPALAITDHGNMHGVISFYERAIEAGIKPIIGMEAYIAPTSRFDKTPSKNNTESNLFHIILLAKNNEGYRNLIKLSTLAFLEGFYYKPRIDKELLREYGRGLIGLSSCLKGEVPGLILKGRAEDAKRAIREYQSILGDDNFFLELQENGLEEQRIANRGLIELGQELSVPLVATNDCHYLHKEDHRAHEILLCINSKKTLEDERRLSFKSKDLYFKSPREMKEMFSEVPKALSNTKLIAEKCNVEIELGKVYLPHYEAPDGKNHEEYLEELCYKGLKERYKEITPEVEGRLRHELDVIKKMGWAGYFLIVYDFTKFAKDRGIPVGPGRGSAVGSIVSYCLGLSAFDPIKYDLLFERFLHPHRVSDPDIDTDLCVNRRQEVIDYVIKKYGQEKVAQIITFGTLGAKSCIRDVGRVMGMPYGEADRIARLIPGGPKVTLQGALNSSPELRDLYKNDPRAREVIDAALKLEGLNRHASIHASAIVIAKDDITNFAPLYKGSKDDDAIATQVDMDDVAKVGLMKFDFLGLQTLTMIHDAVEMIRRTKGVELDIDNIPLDDPETFRLLCEGRTVGIFQFEGSMATDLLRRGRPASFEDLVDLNALNRPGPLGAGMVEDYIARKHGRKPITYDHPLLEPALKSTYGVCIYQEQVMRIASDMGGFTLGEADLLRRAMGKKKPEEMAAQRERFIKGAAERGVDAETASAIFDKLEYFAGYGFNKSHSVAYSFISYQTAYLKAHYPTEFMAALLTSELGKPDKIVQYLSECREMGIEVLPPSVNESAVNFTVVGEGKIRFGLAAIKNVGVQAIQSIMASRERDGPFKNIFDFCERVDLRLINKRVLESLIKAGAFDDLNGKRYARSQMLAVVDSAIASAQAVQKERDIGQFSLLDGLARKDAEDDSHLFPDMPEFGESELLAMEKEVLGIYISSHPLIRYAKDLKAHTNATTSSLKERLNGDRVRIGGMITEVKSFTTKKGNRRMASITLEDMEGSAEVTIFPDVYERVKVKKDMICIVEGTVNLNGERHSKVIASDIIEPPFGPAPGEPPQTGQSARAIYIDFVASELREETLKQLKEILHEFEGGRCKVYFDFTTRGHKRVTVDTKLRVKYCEEMSRKLGELVGEDSVRLV
ncbi:MAG: DNA polymerase III subunit alpha [bacterium]